MKKKIWLYKLTDAVGIERVVVVDDPSDSGCIGGHDREGDYHQFEDSMYHIYDWALQYDIQVSCATMEIDLSEVIFE